VKESIRTVVVDDEQLAREALRIRLSYEPDIALLRECACGREAVVAVRSERPDVLFLDVQMPDLDGFEVLDELGDEGELPLVVFVTAFDEYALAAFDRHAIDYLLKPFDDERFRETLERVRAALRDRRMREWIGRIGSVLAEWKVGRGPGPGRTRGRILVHKNGRRVLLPVGRILYLEARGNYIRLTVEGGDSHLVRGPLEQLQEQLDPLQFARIHRSTIVNLDYVRELRPDMSGGYDVALEDGTILRLSRTYRDGFLGRWG